jgi:hypothetical protein
VSLLRLWFVFTVAICVFTKEFMVSRNFLLRSEEWAALLFLIDFMEKRDGKRPSISLALGRALSEQAKNNGYQGENNERRSNS